MTVSKEQAVAMLDHDLGFFMNDIRGLLAHYRIGDWEAYLFFRKPDCPQSYVLKYEATAGDEFAQKIVALHAVPTADAGHVERARVVTLCLARAAEYKQARDNAYEAVPTCDAVGENEIRQHVAERLAAEIAAPAAPSPAEPPEPVGEVSRPSLSTAIAEVERIQKQWQELAERLRGNVSYSRELTLLEEIVTSLKTPSPSGASGRLAERTSVQCDHCALSTWAVPDTPCIKQAISGAKCAGTMRAIRTTDT